MDQAAARGQVNRCSRGQDSNRSRIRRWASFPSRLPSQLLGRRPLHRLQYGPGRQTEAAMRQLRRAATFRLWPEPSGAIGGWQRGGRQREQESGKQVNEGWAYRQAEVWRAGGQRAEKEQGAGKEADRALSNRQREVR